MILTLLVAALPLVLAKTCPDDWTYSETFDACLWLTDETKGSKCESVCGEGTPICIGSAAQNKAAYKFGKDNDADYGFWIGFTDKKQEGKWCNSGCGKFENWAWGE